MDYLDSVSDTRETTMFIQYNSIELYVESGALSALSFIYFSFPRKISETLKNPHKLPNAS